MVFNLPSLKIGRGKRGGDELPTVAPNEDKPRKILSRYEFQKQWKEMRHQEFEPTKSELISYARSLGIDPMIDGDLMWIAEEALFAPLPVDWTEHHDSGDRVFYFNSETRETSWTHPLEATHREIYKKITSFRDGRLSRSEKEKMMGLLKDICEDLESEAERVLASVTEHTDDQGQKFWYSDRTQKSSWTDPRPAVCHLASLNLKTLVVLHQKDEQSPSGRPERRAASPSTERLADLPPMSDRSHRDRSQKKSHRGRSEDRGRSKEIEGGDQREIRGSVSSVQEDAELDADDEGDAEARRREKKRKRKKEKEKEKERNARSEPPPMDREDDFRRTGPVGPLHPNYAGSKSARSERDGHFPPLPGSTPRIERGGTRLESPTHVTPEPPPSGRLGSARHRRPPLVKEEPMPIPVRTPRQPGAQAGGRFLSGLPPINGQSAGGGGFLPPCGGGRRSLGPGAEAGIRLQPLSSVDSRL